MNDELDILFVEGVQFQAANTAEWALNWSSFLFGLIAMKLYLFLLEKSGKLTGRTDEILIKKLEAHYNAEVIEVDENVHELISDGRYAWAAGHWTVSFLCIVGFPTWSDATLSQFQWLATLIQPIAPISMGWVSLGVLALQAFVWILLGGMAVFLLFVAGTMTSRNHTMVTKIQESVNESPGKSGCLIVGMQHESEITDLLRNSESVKIVE